MKRFCRLHVSVSPLGQAEVDRVVAALSDSGAPPHWVRKVDRHQVYLLEAIAELELGDNDSEQGLAQQLSVAIWKKIGRYVKIVVDTTRDDMPADCFELNERDYRKLMRTH